MSNTENLPDEHFREKLENMEVTPSDRVWSGISSHLERSATARSKRKVAWLWRLSMISLVISLLSVGYVIFGNRADRSAVNGPIAQNTAENSAAQSPAEDDHAVSGLHSSPAGESPVTGSSVPAVKQGTGASQAISSNASASSSQGYTVSPSTDASASGSGSMKISQNSPGSMKEGPKKPSEQEGFFNEGSKLQRNEVRHADPQHDPQITLQEDPKPDPLSNGKTIYSSPMFPVATRQLAVESRRLASELQEVEFEDIPEGKPCPKWIAGVNYTYGMTFRELKDNDPEMLNKYPHMYVDDDKLSKAYFDSVESKSTGYVQGLSLGYRAGRFTLKTGIEQSKHQWQTNMVRGFLETSGPEQTFVIPTTGSYYSNDTLGETYAGDIFYAIWVPPAPDQFEDTVTLVHTFKYTSVPLTLSYSFTRPCSKFGVSLTGGMAASFLQSYTLTQDGSRQSPEGAYINKQSFQLIAGASVSYAPVCWLSVELQPTYRRFIQPVNKEQSVKAYPYMLGAQAGLYFRF